MGRSLPNRPTKLIHKVLAPLSYPKKQTTTPWCSDKEWEKLKIKDLVAREFKTQMKDGGYRVRLFYAGRRLRDEETLFSESVSDSGAVHAFFSNLPLQVEEKKDSSAARGTSGSAGRGSGSRGRENPSRSGARGSGARGGAGVAEGGGDGGARNNTGEEPRCGALRRLLSCCFKTNNVSEGDGA